METWLEVLQAEVAASSLAQVAEKLGLSRTTISQVCNEKYPGDMARVQTLVEGALMEVPDGLLEAAKAMGAKPLQIITKVLLPEALPGILNSVTITLVTLVNYSAMAGAIGGGGLGDVGIRYGYQRFDPTVMLVTVVILVVLVQLIQSAGERLVNKCDHR